MNLPTTNQTFLQQVSPQEMGVDESRWESLLNFAQTLVDSNRVPALSIHVQRAGLTTGTHCFGTVRINEKETVNDQTRFLIASLTKPIVAMAVLKLVEQGKLALNQRVSEIVPEFKGPGKKQITVKQVLTHTSGLPDMLPNNRELRAANATLDEFVKETAATDLVFPSGANAQYQSMGYALLGPLISNLAGQPYADFLSSEIFQPLDMKRAALGLPEAELDAPNIAESRVPDDQVGEDTWNWNSPYWKTFGAPWGGMVATAEDLAKFCRCLLVHGKTQAGSQLFSAETIRMATTNRLNDFPDIPETIRRTRGWGYGWRMNWADHRGSFGDLLSPGIFGHWGATGTLYWLDRRTQTAAVLLSTQPYDRSVSPLVNLSNMICASFTSESC